MNFDERLTVVGLLVGLISLAIPVIGGVVRWVRRRKRRGVDPGLKIGDLNTYADRLRRDTRRLLGAELQNFKVKGNELTISLAPSDPRLFDVEVGPLDVWLDSVAHPDHDATPTLDPLQPVVANPSATELCRWFEAVRNRRLVVLGELGAGKSTLMQHFAVHLLDKRAKESVPVLVSAASWDPGKLSFWDWLAEKLTIVHTFLEDPETLEKGSLTCIQALIRDARILPIVDGLDEMSEPLRRSAVEAFNLALVDDRQGLVVSCITETYEKLASPLAEEGGYSIEHAAGIMLCAPSKADIELYLGQDVKTWPDIANRWAPILVKHGDGSPVGQVFQTPLMVDLGRTVFNQRVHPNGHKVDLPSILLDEHEYPTCEAIEGYLFGKFIAAAYNTRDPAKKSAYAARRADGWLTFLAGKFTVPPDSAASIDEGETVRDLAWWDLETIVKLPLAGLTVGAICGIACGIAAGTGTRVGSGFGMGLGLGCLLALVTGHTIRRRVYGYRHETSVLTKCASGADEEVVGQELRDRLRGVLTMSRDEASGPAAGLAGGLAGGVLGGLTAGLAGALGFGDAQGMASGVAVGLGVGLAAGPNTGFWGGFVGSFAGGFLGGLIPGVGRGTPALVLNGIGVGIGAGLTVHLAPRPQPAKRLAWNPVGALGGLAAGVALGLVTWRVLGSWFGIVLGVVAALLAASVSGLFGTVDERLLSGRRVLKAEEANGPEELLANDRSHFRLIVLAAGGATGLVTLLVVGIQGAFEKHVTPTLSFLVSNGMVTGAAVGLSCGLVLAMVQAAWGRFFLARVWLAATGCLPWRLMRFLADAHGRRVLRKVGADYKFCHPELQRRLARAAWAEERRARTPDRRPRTPEPGGARGDLPASAVPAAG